VRRGGAAAELGRARSLSFKRMCRDAGIGEELHDALTEHSGGGVGRSYGGGFGLKVLAEAMEKMPVPSEGLKV
jgi:hypothetical protein